jgi:N-acetyl-1-D-myo-inositol-2-amino-2-deoxy-alpha-D-glucopyranoside deacetylase
LASRRLLLVHAHPDDEALSTGGTIARYSAEGAHVCLVTCTDGQLGEVAEVPGHGSPDQIRPRLGEVRRAELVEACRRLGEVDLRMLGYQDSGMAGTPGNDDPEAFVNQDLAEVAGRIAEIIDEVRPLVLITYDERGSYGHPDHVRAHEAAMRALSVAEHEVAKVYHTAVPRSLLLMARELVEAEVFTDDEIDRVGTDDELITTAVDVSAYIDRKFAALEAHRTQLGTTGWILSMPAEFRALGFGTEHFVLARSSVRGGEGLEPDLFEGL